MAFNQNSYGSRLTIMYTYIGFRLKTNGVHWYFKDSVQAKFGHPHICYIVFFCLDSFIQLYELKAKS
jgi:hypothetical protein